MIKMLDEKQGGSHSCDGGSRSEFPGQVALKLFYI